MPFFWTWTQSSWISNHKRDHLQVYWRVNLSTKRNTIKFADVSTNHNCLVYYRLSFMGPSYSNCVIIGFVMFVPLCFSPCSFHIYYCYILRYFWTTCVSDLLTFLGRTGLFCPCVLFGRNVQALRRYPMDNTLHLSCCLCWRWHCIGNPYGYIPWCWPRHISPDWWRPGVRLVVMLYIYW